MAAKTLMEKLGYKPGMAARTWDAPPELADALALLRASERPVFLLAFARDQAALAERSAEAIPLYQRGAWLWFAYPKRTGRLKSDLTRDHGWAPVGAAGLLGVTQVALDETWSALRFRFRDEIRKLTRSEPL